MTRISEKGVKYKTKPSMLTDWNKKWDKTGYNETENDRCNIKILDSTEDDKEAIYEITVPRNEDRWEQ